VTHRFLSYLLNDKTPLYGSNPPLSVTPDRSMAEGAHCNTAMVSLHNHTGTHMDAPRHFVDGAASVSDFSADDYWFRKPCVVDVTLPDGELLIKPEHIGEQGHRAMRDADLVILNTGYYRKRYSEAYTTANPGISIELARQIREEYPSVRAVGLDSLSVSSRQHREVGHEAHTILLGSNAHGPGVILIEDMDLSAHGPGLREVVVAPLLIEGIDGAPVTVMARYEDASS
jgi:arylformamidase